MSRIVCPFTPFRYTNYSTFSRQIHTQMHTKEIRAHTWHQQLPRLQEHWESLPATCKVISPDIQVLDV